MLCVLPLCLTMKTKMCAVVSFGGNGYAKPSDGEQSGVVAVVPLLFFLFFSFLFFSLRGPPLLLVSAAALRHLTLGAGRSRGIPSQEAGRCRIDDGPEHVR